MNFSQAQPLEPASARVRAAPLPEDRISSSGSRTLSRARAPRQQPILLEHGGDAAAEIIEIACRAFVADVDRRLGWRSRPIIRSKKVDLPQPVWPTMATTSRGAMRDPADRWRRPLARWWSDGRPCGAHVRRSGAARSCRLYLWRFALMRAIAACAPQSRDDRFQHEQQCDQDQGPGEDVGDGEQFLRHRELVSDAGHRADQFGDGDDADREAQLRSSSS